MDERPDGPDYGAEIAAFNERINDLVRQVGLQQQAHVQSLHAQVQSLHELDKQITAMREKLAEKPEEQPAAPAPRTLPWREFKRQASQGVSQ